MCPASFSVNIGGAFLKFKAAGTWSWPVTSIKSGGSECLQLYRWFAVFPSCCCTTVTEFIAQNKYLILRSLAPLMCIMWKQYNCFHFISIINDLYKNWRATRRLNESRFVIGHPGMLCRFCREMCGASHRCAPVPGNLSVPNRSVVVFKRVQKIFFFVCEQKCKTDILISRFISWVQFTSKKNWSKNRRCR